MHDIDSFKQKIVNKLKNLDREEVYIKGEENV